MPDPLSRLVGELSRLPGIGPKTATRLAHHLLKVSKADAAVLAESILEIKDKLLRTELTTRDIERERNWLAEQIKQRDEAYKVPIAPSP